jgi:uncharacterized protein (DUF1697 family)
MAENTWIALLRGINLGRAKRVAMADLRALLEELGYQDVRTLRNSGNVVLTAPETTAGEVAVCIETALIAQLGVSARAIVLTAAELTTVVRDHPASKEAPGWQVAFLADPADRACLEPLLGREWHPEAIVRGQRVAYLWLPGGVRPSPLLKAIDKVLGDRVTTRTWSTVIKLHDLSL